MAGQLVPLVLLPRYTTYVGKPGTGAGTIGVAYFSTIAMDVTQYSSAIISVWRGKLIGSPTPGITFTLQESMDQVSWTDLTAGFDPGENIETETTVSLTKRWFRIIVLLGGADNACSCYAVGFLEERLS